MKIHVLKNKKQMSCYSCPLPYFTHKSYELQKRAADSPDSKWRRSAWVAAVNWKSTAARRGEKKAAHSMQEERRGQTDQYLNGSEEMKRRKKKNMYCHRGILQIPELSISGF